MLTFPITSKEAKQRALRAVMGIMKKDDCEVVIRKRQQQGTTQQQAWFNMLCKMIADEIGDHPEAVKAAIKKKRFGTHVATIGGVEVEFIPRSDYHGKKGYSDLIEQAYIEGAEMGIILPEPSGGRSDQK